jgi:trans-2,3-dihydro-3-hydroxyanthranilate isomerase
MASYRYRLVNVFSLENQAFSGNPLCVFEDASGLSDEAMQALALQFNLSETTFVFPSGSVDADARVRIFTSTFEIPFAGHPTLGTAHVLFGTRAGADTLRLGLNVGVVPVTRGEAGYTLMTHFRGAREVSASRGQLAAMLGIEEHEIAGEPRWVNAGNEQLFVPLASAEAVQRCAPDPRALARLAASGANGCLVYVFAETAPERVTARLFFKVHAAVVEDPATGSACANLGGFLLANGAALPLRRQIAQGEALKRPSRLELYVDAERRIFVSGRVHELGHGVVEV